DHVGMAVEVLGGGVQHQVGAVLEGTLQDRRGEGVVDHEQQPVPAGDGRNRLDVDDFQRRVGRRLDPEHAGLRCDRGLDGGGVGQVDEAEVQARAAPADAFEQAVAATVEVVHGDHVVATVEELEHGRGRGQARSEGEAAAAEL